MVLTAKKKRFCEEYCVDSNGTQAAIRAGYSNKTAGQIAEQLLKKLEIQEYIETLRKESTTRVKVTVDQVVEGFSNIAFTDPAELFEKTDKAKKSFVVKDIWEIPKPVRLAIASIAPVQINGEVHLKITLCDRAKALESLGKYLGMFSDFNGAIATLKTYGIHLQQTEDGWSVKEEK